MVITRCAGCEQELDVPLRLIIDGILEDRDKGEELSRFLCESCILSHGLDDGCTCDLDD